MMPYSRGSAAARAIGTDVAAAGFFDQHLRRPDIPQLHTVIHGRSDQSFGGEHVRDAVDVAAHLSVLPHQPVECAPRAALDEARPIADRDHFAGQVRAGGIPQPEAPPVTPGAEPDRGAVAAVQRRQIDHPDERPSALMERDDRAVERDAVLEAGGAVDRIEDPLVLGIGMRRRELLPQRRRAWERPARSRPAGRARRRDRRR